MINEHDLADALKMPGWITRYWEDYANRPGLGLNEVDLLRLMKPVFLAGATATLLVLKHTDEDILPVRLVEMEEEIDRCLAEVERLAREHLR